MEVSRPAFHTFDLDEEASLLSFDWTEKSAGMTDADYKQALREYASLVLKRRVRPALIDLREFDKCPGGAPRSARARARGTRDLTGATHILG
jgi:hypothetical protein